MHNTSKKYNGSKTIAIVALLSSLALIFSYIEFLIPSFSSIPGAKLGLSNLVIVIAFYLINPTYAFAINIIRIIVAGLLFNGIIGMTYGIIGGILSFGIMILLKKINRFSIIGISMSGGVFHNLGQLFAASILLNSFNVFYYLPVLMISGMISGTIIGILAHITLGRINPLLK